MSSTEIRRDLPNDEYQAAVGANSASASNVFATIADLVSAGGIQHAIAAGTNTYTATITGVTAYTDGDVYAIRFTNGNDADSTININGLGAITLTKQSNIQVTGGDIISNQEIIIVYDGTNFQCINVAPNQLFAYVTNDDAVTINKGQPVYAFSAAGNRMSVKLAFNTSDATSAQTVGVVFSTSIAPNQRGFVITQGVIDGLDTSMYAAGDQLYLGATAGSLTNVKPYAPNHLVYIGIVERANAGNGQIYVKPQNGYELDELHDVDLITTPPAIGDALIFDGTLWVPGVVSPVNIYNTDGTLTGNRIVTMNANTLLFDGTNSDIRYTPNSVGGYLQLEGKASGVPRFGISVPAFGLNPAAGFQLGMRAWDDPTFAGYGQVGDAFFYAGNATYGLNFLNPPGVGTADYIRFYAGIDATGTSHIHIQGTGATKGYVGLGTETPTEKLDVNGKTKTTTFQMTTAPTAGYVLTSDASGNASWSAIPVEVPTEFVFVSSKSDLPAAVAGVITLSANYTYFFTTTVDLTGDRLVCGQNTTILGGSSENCRIKSTGLVGTALITSTASLPMRNITIEADVALNLNAATPATDALDWFGVNFTDCATVGTIANYSNVIFQDSAFLNSGNLTFDGTMGTIGASQCLFNCNATGTVFTLAPTLTVTRRFRIVYSSFVVLAGEKGIDTTPAPTIPDDGFIFNYCNFSGGGTYLDGYDYTSVKSLFINNVGITNTSNVGHNYMINNTTDTIIGIPNVNVWVKAAGTTTLGVGNSPKWTQPVTNRLLYGGVVTSDFVYNAVGTVQSATNNQVISVAFAKNGVIQAESEITVRTATSNQPYPFSLQDVISVATGDYVEIYVLNTQSADIRVGDLNVIIQKVTG